MTSEAPRASPRDLTVDVVRGIGIVLVVYGHVLRGLDSRGLLHMPSRAVQDAVIYSFHMPLFFLLSGLFVERSLRDGRAAFLRPKLVTIVYPYFFWSILQTVLANHFTPGSKTAVGDAALATMLWAPIAEFWFLYALMLCFLALAMLWPSRLAIGLLAAISFIFPQLDYSGPPIFTIGLESFFFVGVGFLASRWFVHGIPTMAKPILVAITLAAAACFALLNVAKLESTREWMTSALDVTALAGIVMTFGIAALGGRWLHWLAPLGQTSMAIYVLHTILIGIVRAGLFRLGLWEEHVLLILLTIAGLILPLSIYRMASRLKIAPYVGLGNNDRRARV